MIMGEIVGHGAMENVMEELERKGVERKKV